MKIPIAADGSPYTKRMLAHLAAHEDWLGSAHQYTVVYCTPAISPRAKAYFDRETLRSHSESEFEKVFKAIRAFFKRHHMELAFIGKTGPAAEVIGALSDAGKFDLLVMGSHGHGALGSLRMGSVVTKVMARCKTPLLIVR